LAGEIPEGHGSVFHFLDIFALGCGLEALAGLHKGDPLWIVAAYVIGAVAFHLLGTKWPLIRAKLGERAARLIRWAVMALSILLIGYIALYVLQLRSDLDAYAMPRKVSKMQAENIKTVLSGHDPGITVDVIASVADKEALEYAGELMNAIKAGGWDARLVTVNPWETGDSSIHEGGNWSNIYPALDSGVSLRVGTVGPPTNPDPRHPTPDALLAEAFQRAGNISNGGGGGPSRDGKYHLDVEVGRRPTEIRTPTVRSQIGQWIMRHWIMVAGADVIGIRIAPCQKCNSDRAKPIDVAMLLRFPSATDVPRVL
jgi:hypothetical protein